MQIRNTSNSPQLLVEAEHLTTLNGKKQIFGVLAGAICSVRDLLRDCL